MSDELREEYTVEMNMEEDKAEFPWVTAYRGNDLKAFRTKAEADTELERINE